MSRRFCYFTPDGRGYSAKRRGKFLAASFVGPDGKRLERMTGEKKLDAKYYEEAVKLIAIAFTDARPAESRIGWDDAMKEVEATSRGVRPATWLAYKKGVRQLRATFEADKAANQKPSGPADITTDLAKRFGRLFLSTSYTRGKSTTRRERSPVTLSFYLRSLSGLWRHFIDLGHATANPWPGVHRPRLEKKQKYVPTDSDTTAFFTWIGERYPTWERLRALLLVKLYSGCRTADLCQLRSDQLKDETLVFEASQTKNKAGRTVPLPADLFATLKRLAGPVYLWDGWNREVERFRAGVGKHTARYRVCRNLSTEFQPSTVYVVLCNLFREYSDAHSDRPRMTPHAFRRRAITVMVTATQSVDLTAQALGLNAQTARTYYLDSQRAFNTEEAFKLASEKLLPGPHNPPTNHSQPSASGLESTQRDTPISLKS